MPRWLLFCSCPERGGGGVLEWGVLDVAGYVYDGL